MNLGPTVEPRLGNKPLNHSLLQLRMLSTQLLKLRKIPSRLLCRSCDRSRIALGRLMAGQGPRSKSSEAEPMTFRHALLFVFLPRRKPSFLQAPTFDASRRRTRSLTCLHVRRVQNSCRLKLGLGAWRRKRLHGMLLPSYQNMCGHDQTSSNLRSCHGRSARVDKQTVATFFYWHNNPAALEFLFRV